MSMRPQPWPEPSEEIAAAVRAMYPGRKVPLPVAIRDQLGEVFTDEEFGAAFAARGKPGWSPGRLALVTVLQMAENLACDEDARRILKTPGQARLGVDDHALRVLGRAGCSQ